MKKIISVCMLLCLIMISVLACGNATDNSAGKDSSETVVRVASLKGPTSIGLVNLMKDNEEGISSGKYEFTMEVQADVLLASMVQGNIDIALVPANVASVLYAKTEGKVSVIDINTLGVLYFVSSDDSISSVSDLAGKDIYLTGKGTTPDFVLQYLLDKNGVKDANTQYFSEATEVLNALINNEGAVAFLPQPFVTVATIQNENLKVVLDSNECWKNVQGENTAEGQIVTGVTIVRNEFLKEHPEAVATFMDEHKTSAEKANKEVDITADLIVYYGIIEKEPVAKKAIPYCNITYVDGQEMKDLLSAYLDIIGSFDSSFIGGNVPADDFYYIR